MRFLICFVMAIVGMSLFAETAEAQLFRRGRQPQVVNQIQVGGGGAQLVAPVRAQQFRGGYGQNFVQPVLKQRQFVQPVYAQPVVQRVYTQQFVQPVVQPYCGGGGLQLQQGYGCSSFFVR